MKEFLFTHSMAHNSAKAKYAFISLVITFVLCILAMYLSKHFWEGNTTLMYSLKYQHNVEVGWPVTVFNWSILLAASIVLILPFMYYMQDWKNPAIAMTTDALFVNQQLMRNTLIPFTSIKSLMKEKETYVIEIKNTDEIIQQQIFLFKPFVKSNLANHKIYFDSMYNEGNMEKFFEVLKTKIS
ncbi:MAG: hypothetical protein WCP57_12260 [Bacteroidota bacterium]